MIKDVLLKSILFDVTDTQGREMIDRETVEAYSLLWIDHGLEADGTPFKEHITLFQDGKSYYIGDGWHRLISANNVGRKKVQAEVREGGKRAAILFACGANDNHGLRRKIGDKRRCVQMMLDDPEWQMLPDNQIAKKCNVSPTFVASMRKALPTEHTAKVNPRSKAGGGKGAEKLDKDSAAREGVSDVQPEDEAIGSSNDGGTDALPPCPVCGANDWINGRCGQCGHVFGETPAIEPEQRPAKAVSINPAALVDSLMREHVSKISKRLDEIADANGGKGHAFEHADGGLCDLIDGLERMKGGEQ
jgi:hypothetical protein